MTSSHVNCIEFVCELECFSNWFVFMQVDMLPIIEWGWWREFFHLMLIIKCPHCIHSVFNTSQNIVQSRFDSSCNCFHFQAHSLGISKIQFMLFKTLYENKKKKSDEEMRNGMWFNNWIVSNSIFYAAFNNRKDSFIYWNNCNKYNGQSVISLMALKWNFLLLRLRFDMHQNLT